MMTPIGERSTKVIQITKDILNYLKMDPKSLSQAWLLGALHNEWKKMKGYDKFDPDENEGQLQSSLSEWEESIKKYKNDK